LEFLSPYSPELNPIERVWKLIRRLATHNQYFQTLTQVCEWKSNMGPVMAIENGPTRFIATLTG